MKIDFYKYQGTGNDFVMIDDRASHFPADDIGLVAALCHRRFGIGADGLILLQQKSESGLYMKYYNSDGRESSMCGNGGRCFAAFAHFLDIAAGNMSFMAVDGLHEAVIEGNHVKLRMKDVLKVEKRAAAGYVLDTGSPHYVVFTEKNLDSFDMVEEAKKIRYNEEFMKEGINVNFIRTVSPDCLQIRTYERGVEDETLSCGTGVTASALAYSLFAQLPSAHHELALQSRGGGLKVSFDLDSTAQTFTNVWLQGPVDQVFEGSTTADVRKI